MRVPCPYCVQRTGSLGKRPYSRHLSLYRRDGQVLYLCFRCRAGGRVNSAVLRQLGISSEDLNNLSEVFGDPSDCSNLEHTERDITSDIPSVDISEETFPARRGRAYFRRRGISGEAVEASGVRVCIPNAGVFRDALAFPTLDAESPGTVYRLRFGGYRMPGVKRESTLYGFGAIRGADNVWVVEGIFDALALWPEPAVALLGKDASRRQMERLCGLDRELIVSLDGDAWEESKVLAQRLTLRGARVSWVRLPAGRDPCDLLVEGMRSLERCDA